MSRIRTFLVGRHQDCDLRLDDTTVSRRHAEVVLTPDGRYYVTDCNSAGGSYLFNNGSWQPIRQAFVTASDRLRFGDLELPASRLEALRALLGGGGNAAAQAGTPPPEPQPRLDPNRGLVRDPVTGEIIERT